MVFNLLIIYTLIQIVLSKNKGQIFKEIVLNKYSIIKKRIASLI